MRNLVDIATATSASVRTAVWVLVTLALGLAAITTVATVIYANTRDRAEVALWTVSGPPCQRIAPTQLSRLTGGEPGQLSFGQAQGAFVNGAVVCADIDRDHGRRTRPFTVCQFGSPSVVRLDTPGGQIFFQAPPGQSVTISFAGGQPSCVLGSNLPSALLES